MIFCDDVCNDYARYTGEGCSAKIKEEMISFPPLHVYSHPRKESPPYKTFLDSEEKAT